MLVSVISVEEADRAAPAGYVVARLARFPQNRPRVPDAWGMAWLTAEEYLQLWCERDEARQLAEAAEALNAENGAPPEGARTDGETGSGGGPIVVSDARRPRLTDISRPRRRA